MNLINCDERRLMREKLIAKQYSDEYLQNIINNTKNFISDNLLILDNFKDLEEKFKNENELTRTKK